MITIGAQANGYITGQDSTALSSINKGLKDRVKPVIQDAGKKDIEQPPQPLNVQYADQVNAFNIFLAKIGSVNGAYPGWDQEAIDAYRNTNNAFAEYDQYKATVDAQALDPKKAIGSPTIGFLPFDLTLTIDGLSGMKVYQKYIVDTDFLPSNYPLSLEFLIKGITHTIQNNQWITTLESVAIPKNPFGMKNAQGQTYNGSPATVGGRPVGVAAETGQPTRGNNFSPSTGTPPSNSPKLYKAVQQQSAWFFSVNPPTSGKCARYVYNIAYNLKKHIDTNSQQAITFDGIKSSANADQPDYRKKLDALGLYDQTFVGSMTISQLNTWINKSTFNYGDSLVYYAPGHSGKTNMHAQIYTGNIYNASVGWTTSNKTNYNTKVVYNAAKSPFLFDVYLFKVKPQYVV
jgi:hypothetical protein